MTKERSPWRAELTPGEATAILATLNNLGNQVAVPQPALASTIAAINSHVLAGQSPVPPLDSTPTTLGSAAARELCVRLASILPFLSGTYQQSTFSAVANLAEDLHVEADFVTDLDLAGRHHLMRMRYDILRKDAYGRTQEGTLAFTREMISDGFGWDTDANVAGKYESLEKLPDGTVGRAFWLHYDRNGFPLPGERHGLPERFIVPHDMAHVLFGYSTALAGELLVTAAQSGFQSLHPVSGLMFGLFQWQVGMTIDKGITTGQGNFEPESYFSAIERGAATSTDLYLNWDWWPIMEQNLTEARQTLGVPAIPSATPAAAQEEALLAGEVVSDPNPVERGRVRS
ncbi:MAG: ubiquinone biosynthesis protein COQ4 [Actinomycetia bacterium]|nr:ubiquinone biosynthesis protein COQ4 [Actinomycetes bacterium]